MKTSTKPTYARFKAVLTLIEQTSIKTDNLWIYCAKINNNDPGVYERTVRNCPTRVGVTVSLFTTINPSVTYLGPRPFQKSRGITAAGRCYFIRIRTQNINVNFVWFTRSHDGQVRVMLWVLPPPPTHPPSAVFKAFFFFFL